MICECPTHMPLSMLNKKTSVRVINVQNQPLRLSLPLIICHSLYIIYSAIFFISAVRIKFTLYSLHFNFFLFASHKDEFPSLDFLLLYTGNTLQMKLIFGALAGLCTGILLIVIVSLLLLRIRRTKKRQNGNGAGNGGNCSGSGMLTDAERMRPPHAEPLHRQQLLPQWPIAIWPTQTEMKMLSSVF